MATKKQLRKKKEEKAPKKEAPTINEPWIGQRAGLRFMALLSLVLAIYMAWQLWPSEGPLGAILWGLGFGVAIWAVFGLSLAFTKFVRRNKS